MKKQKGNSSLTLDFFGIEVEVDFNYYKGDSGYREFMGSGGNPPDPEEVEILAIYYKEVDLIDLFVGIDILIERLEEKIYSYEKY